MCSPKFVSPSLEEVISIDLVRIPGPQSRGTREVEKVADEVNSFVDRSNFNSNGIVLQGRHMTIIPSREIQMPMLIRNCGIK